jgi:hypothetical protein
VVQVVIQWIANEFSRQREGLAHQVDLICVGVQHVKRVSHKTIRRLTVFILTSTRHPCVKLEL